MPPKKKQPNGSGPLEKTGDTGAKPKHEGNPKNTNGTSQKRKAGTPSSTSNKAARRSARGAPQNSVEPLKLLQYLLSPASLDKSRPKDEIEDLENRDADTRTYSSSSFSPFEELVCATVLSRPIGHLLGLRSIRTIFNGPYDLTTPKKIREAGNEGCRAALDKARTQHRQKTAEELVILADAVVNILGSGEDDVSLEKVREESGKDVAKERDMLKKNVKGLGKTGLDIFGRRIQGVWDEWYPFVDERTLGAIEKLGLPGDAEGLRKLMEEHWGKLDIGDVKTKDEKEMKRKAFVRILERAVGADLEGNIDILKAEAA